MRAITPDGKAINQNTLAAALPYGFGGDDHRNRTTLRYDIAAPHQEGSGTFIHNATFDAAAKFALGGATLSR